MRFRDLELREKLSEQDQSVAGQDQKERSRHNIRRRREIRGEIIKWTYKSLKQERGWKL